MKKIVSLFLSVLILFTIINYSNVFANEEGGNGEEGITAVTTEAPKTEESTGDSSVNAGGEVSVQPEAIVEKAVETETPEAGEGLQQNGNDASTNADIASAMISEAVNAMAPMAASPIVTDIVNLLFYNDENKTDYLTGSEITHYVGPEVSGSDTVLNGWYTIVTVPKKYLDLSFNNSAGIKVSNAESLLGNPEITGDTDNFYVRYNYSSLKGGTRVEIPFIFKTKNYTTADGTTFTINSKLYDDGGNEIKTSDITIKNLSSTKYSTYRNRFEYTESKYREGNFTHTSSNLDELDSFSFYTYYKNDIYGGNSNTLGVFNPKKVKITLKLKDGIVFDEANTANSSWTYDSTNRTLTKIVNSENRSDWIYVGNIFLKTPNFEYNKDYIAFETQATGLDEDGNEIDSSRSDWNTTSVYIRKRNKQQYSPSLSHYKSRPNDYYYIDDNKDKIVEWTIKSTENSSWINVDAGIDPNTLEYKPIYLYQISDYGLDKHLYYYSIKIDAASYETKLDDKTVLNENILYGKTNSGNKVEITRNIPIDTEFLIPEGNHLNKDEVYRELYLEFPNRIELKRQQSVKLVVKTKVFEQDWENAKNDGPWFLDGSGSLIGPSLYNRTQGYYSINRDLDNPDAASKAGDYYYYYIKAGGTTYIGGNVDNSTRLIGETAKLDFPVQAQGRDLGNNQYNDLENGKVVIIIPNGWEYINEGSNKTRVTYTKFNGTYNQNHTMDYNPVLEYDYKGTGKRALIFNLDDLPDRAKNTNHVMTPYINLKAVSSTPEGNSDVEAYLSYTNVGKYDFLPNSSYGKKVDQYDINENGNATEELSYAKLTIKYVPPREVVGIKKAGNSLTSLVPIATSIMDLGNKFYYSFEIKNLQKNVPVKSFEIMDILPHIGDKVVIPNKDGEYAERNSQFNTHLLGPIKLLEGGNLINPDGYTISYSKDTPEAGNTAANLAKTFTSDVDDWTEEDFKQVTMFKIRMNPGLELAAQDSVEFAVSAIVPNDKDNIKDGMISNNSFAFAPSNAENANFTPDSYIEVNKVTVPVARYVINGTIYRDFNYSEEFNTEEKGISDIKIGLFDENDNLLEETLTNRDGFYSFEVLKRGKYKVKILDKPDYYDFYDVNKIPAEIFPQSTISNDKLLVNGLEVKNDMDNTGISQLVEVNPNHKLEIVNAPLTDLLMIKEVEKIWEGKAAPVEEIKVILKADGQEKELSVLADDNWIGKLENLRKFDKNGAEYNYELEELKVEGFVLTTIETSDKGFKITNLAELPKPSITPNSDKPKANVNAEFNSVPNTSSSSGLLIYVLFFIVSAVSISLINKKS